MRIMVLPPLRVDEINGGRTRTIEIYSRMGGAVEATLVVDSDSLKHADGHYIDRLGKCSVEKGYAGRNPFRLLRSFLHLSARGRRMDAILCYAEFGPSVIYSYIVSFLSRKPLLIVVHHVEDGLRKRGFLMNRAFRRATGILALDNPEVIAEVRRLFPDRPVAEITNGVDPDHYRSAAGARGHADCLYVGVLSQRKGMGLLADVWKGIHRSLPEARMLILAGITPDSEVKQFLATLHEASDGLTVEGYVGEEEKVAAYRGSSVFVFPSTYEGFGLVIAESMAAGTPVVLWDLPSFSRFSGGVVKVKYPDTEAFASEVVRLLNDEKQRKQLSAAGMKFSEEQLSWDVAAAKEMKAIAGLLQPAGAGRV